MLLFGPSVSDWLAACCMLHTTQYKLNSTDGKEKMIGDIIGDEG